MALNLERNGKTSFFDDRVQALDSYHQFGFHVEENVFTGEECQNYIAIANQLSAAKEGDFKPFMMPHRERPEFLTAMKNKKIVEIINTLVGGKAVGLQSQFFFCKPGTRGFSMHQDNFFVQAKQGVFVSAWIALVDTTPKNAGLIVYPGTHKEGDLPVRKLNLERDVNQDPNANNEEVIIPPQYHEMHLSIKRGSVLFIHGHVVHGSNPNLSDSDRSVLLNTYIKEGEAFRSGAYAQRSPLDLSL